MSAAFKGSSKGLGIELYRGTMAYLNYVNQRGGVHGRPVVIKAYDDGYNPDPAIGNTIRLIEKDNVLLLFDYVGTPTVTRVLPLLKKFSRKHVLLVFPFTGAEPQRVPPYSEFVFNLRASYKQETEKLVNFFMKSRRTRIAVFYQADAYGRSGWDGVRQALAKYKRKIVGEATYRRGTNFSESLKKQAEIIKSARPDAVISIGAYQACAAFIRDSRDTGLTVPIANVSFVGSESMLSLLLEASQQTKKDYTRRLINSQVVPSYEDTAIPAVREYRMLMDRFNPMPSSEITEPGYKPLRYSFVSFEGFLNAKVLVEILSRLGKNIRKERLKSFIESMSRIDIGLNTPVSFGPNRHQGLDDVYLTTFAGGKFVPLKNAHRWTK